jgi:PAS domain S-box-containing protein
LYRESNDLLIYTNSVINSLSGGFISTDLLGNVTRFNDAACRILGVTLAEVLNKPILKSLSAYPAFAAILEVTLKRQNGASRQEIELQRPNGGALFIGYSTFLVRSETQIHGAGILFQDLTNIRK